MLETTQVQTRVAHQIHKDAASEGIPLVIDVEQGRWEFPSIVVRHYDFGKDLSLSEIRVIQQLCKIAASKVDCELHFTLETLRFSVTERPKSEGTKKGLRKIQAETDAAIAEYIEACRPHYKRNAIPLD